MYDQSYYGSIVFIAAFILQLSAVIPIALIKNERRSLYVANSVLLAGLVLALISTLTSALFSPKQFSDSAVMLFNGWVRLDGLGLYFLFIVQLVAIPTVVFNFSYLQHYIEQGRAVKSFIICFVIMLLATQVLVIANQAILFLVGWEVMSMSAYLGMLLEKEKEEVQKGSFYYFVASHVLI